jgi:hypothetical protein
MKLRGRRVLINIPEKKESVIELTEKDKAMIQEDEMKIWTRLVVHAVGTDVTEVAVGEVVLLNWNAAIKVQDELYSTKVENIIFVYEDEE